MRFPAGSRPCASAVRAQKLTPSPPLLLPRISTQNYGYGLYTAVDAHTATWSFKPVQADGGPADYSDKLTIKK